MGIAEEIEAMRAVAGQQCASARDLAVELFRVTGPGDTDEDFIDIAEAGIDAYTSAYLSASIHADVAGEVKELRRLEEFGTATDEATASALGRAAALISALSADNERSEAHRNDLMDKIVEQQTEIGALRRRAETAEAREKKLEVLGALADVAAERRRQIEAEGFTPDHDDAYQAGDLSAAASCYAIGTTVYWPWERSWWKPTERRRDLVKAGALIVAEIEHLDRRAARSVAKEAGNV